MVSGRKNNYKVDATQELFAIGASNLLSAFVGSYPITGSFGRFVDFILWPNISFQWPFSYTGFYNHTSSQH